MMKRGVVLKAVKRLLTRHSSGRRTFVKRASRNWGRLKAERLSARKDYRLYSLRRPTWQVWVWPERRVKAFREGVEFFPLCIVVLVDDQTGKASDKTWS